MEVWNPWHGCRKISPGCMNCYVYRRDSFVGKDASIVSKTKSFDLPVRKSRNGGFKIRLNAEVFTCGTSDFFIEEADEWRREAWGFIRERKDLFFLIITKRIDRFQTNLPSDWGRGYPNVRIGCTVENQKMADFRLPIFIELPIAHKIIISEPLLGNIDISGYLNENIDMVVAGGESGKNGRVCDYSWVLDIRAQCIENKVPFYFKQTGTHFKKDGRLYTIPRKLQHAQARKAAINT